MAELLAMNLLPPAAADKVSPPVPLYPAPSPALADATGVPAKQCDATTLVARRGVLLPQLPALPKPSALRRPGITPLQGRENSNPSSSSRSVRFNEMPSLGSVLSPPLASMSSASELLPQHNRAGHPEQTLFGKRTRFRPLWLLALGNAGSCLFGSGEVVLQRDIWPTGAYLGLNNSGVTALPGGEAGDGVAFGGRTGGIIGGTMLMAVGVAMTLTASALFLSDGRRLNRRQNPAKPNYRRTMGYFYTHLFGVALLVGHRFTIEGFRLHLGPRWQWVAATPGATGQAIFAITQAQSFSSCEVLYGKQPLWRRGLISATARVGVAAYVILAAILGSPNFSAYWREIIRLVAQSSSTLAFALPLTTARLSQPLTGSPLVEHGEERFRGDWTAIQIYSVYALARLSSMLGAFWLEHARWPTAPMPTDPAFAAGANVTGWQGLPPPIPYGDADWDSVSCASFLLLASTVLGMYSFYQFRKDASPPAWWANALFGLATLCLIMGQVYRVGTENAKAHADFKRIWEMMPIGFLANAIAFVVIPEMFSSSEITRRNTEIKYRYQVTEACRASGILCFSLWASMSGVLGFPPLARMMMNWCGSIFTILGFSLPTSETRRAQTGSLGTPQGEPSDWLTAHTLSR